MTYRAVRSSRGRGMAGTALRRLLTCDRISRTLRLVDSCLDAIWSMTRGMRTWRKRSSLTSSVKPRAVRALLSAASSSASVGAGDAISDALRLRSVVTIPTFAIRPVLPGADASDGTDLRLRSRSRTHKKPLSALSVILSIFTRVPAPGYIPVSTPRVHRGIRIGLPRRSLTPPCSPEPPGRPRATHPSALQPSSRRRNPSP